MIRRRSVIKGQVEHMFLGRYNHSLDNKGRLTIPSRYREMIGDGAVVVQGFDRNLLVLSAASFERVTHEIKAESITNPQVRLLRRLVFSTAEPAEVDKAGRILIPAYLRQFAGLELEAVLVGVGDYFEIWSPVLWAEQNERLMDVEANEQRFSMFDITTQA